MLDDDAILRVIQEHQGDLKGAARALVRAANNAGGEDNITVVAFEVTDEPEERTMEMVVPTVPEPEPELEDTLTEADRVPTVDDAAPREPRRRRWWPLFVLLLAIVAAAIVLWFLVR
jgi:serine/threonine protein phosphatase PrpC